MVEIEKRYKLKSKKELDLIPKENIQTKKYIEQVYSNFNPDVRIRKIEQDNQPIEYYHTVKYFLKNNQREELEQSITKEQYNKIFDIIDKNPLRKNRYLIDIKNGLIAEVDEFLDTEDTIIEVEFKNENQMNNFIKPDWFGEEIKDKRSFSLEIFININNKIEDIYDIIRKEYIE